MDTSQQHFVATHYSSRAQSYVASLDHSTGEDLHQIEAELRRVRAARALDLGCGGGHVTYRAAPHVAEIVACDVTGSMLESVARTAAERGLSNVAVQQAAAECLPFDDASFDIVLCRFTAHHWQSWETGLREARRVLNANGRAIFIDVVAPQDPVLDTHLQAFELLRDPSHVRNYSVAEWIAALARAGFNLTSVTARKLPLDFPVWIARTDTSAENAIAIRSLQAAAPAVVRHHFGITPDGGFHLDTSTFLVRVA